MKRITFLLTLLLMSTLVLMAGKAGPQAKLTVSCTVCHPGDTVSIAGSGFPSRATVTFAIYGPRGAGMTFTANGKGQFVVIHPLALDAPAGQYTATATSSSTSATTSFQVQ